MPMSAAMMQALLDAGATPEMLVRAAAAEEKRDEEKSERKRELARLRKQKQRAKSRDDVTLVTRDMEDKRDTPPQKEKSPPAPPLKKNTPPQSSEPNGSSAGTARDEDVALNRWNEMAASKGLPQAQKLTPSRSRALSARLAECGGLVGWDAALGKVAASSFCTGLKTSFRADLDFVLQAKSFTRLMEGSYDDTPKPDGGTYGQSRSHPVRQSSSDSIRQGVRSALAGRRVREPSEPRDQGGWTDRPNDEHPGRMAPRTVSLERGEDGTYADFGEHQRRYAGARH